MKNSQMAPNEGLFSFQHICPVQIRFGDVDIAGHVNNAVYQHYFDTAKLSYFRFVFDDAINWDREGFVLASIQIDYLLPVYLDDEIEVASRIIKTGNKSLHIRQELRRSADKEVLATATSVMVAYHFRTKEAIELPDAWLKKIQEKDPIA